MQQMKFSQAGFPYFDSEVFRTPGGTLYLKHPGVALVAAPSVDLSGILGFLDGFDPDLGFATYLDDAKELHPAESLVKFMAQSCYLSLGTGRTMNDQAKRYFDNLKSSGHGSVAEHANFSFYFWGIDRTVTHELVRHRAGFAYSQVSQRYVDGSRLRFVERPEYQCHPADWRKLTDMEIEIQSLHLAFEERIDRAVSDYEESSVRLGRSRELGHPMLQGASKTDLRKQVNQVARECLPNSTEAPIGVTANVRAWRHACEMRAHEAADVQIRILFMMVYRCLAFMAPILFDDYQTVDLKSSATESLSTSHRKI